MPQNSNGGLSWNMDEFVNASPRIENIQKYLKDDLKWKYTVYRYNVGMRLALFCEREEKSSNTKRRTLWIEESTKKLWNVHFNNKETL